ncbi:MAG: acetoin utilization protein AcuC [Deltaproteobacteria bacterium]|nr:acetoin utilization protein AcuC [Deltaproteobacteria bacterium]
MGKDREQVLVFSKNFSHHSYGPQHPLKVERLQLTMDLISAYGLFETSEDPWIEAQEADEQDLLLVHSKEYLQILKEANDGKAPPQGWKYGLGSGDNPVFPGLYDWSLLVTGATVECVRQIMEEHRKIAFNIGGGLHHAMESRASGFCYLNDPAVGIAKMVQDGLRVLYLDVDVHHGDGVQAAFYDTDQVLTISLHQHGQTLFPGTGFPDEMGKGKGKGYAVNVPLAPGTDDDLYLSVFMEVVPPLVHAYKPDVLVTQLGVDSLSTDPLATMDLTVNGFSKLVGEMKSWDLKWVALGGGGYNMMNVARAWTKAWAIMKGIRLSENLPEAFVQQHQAELGQNPTLSGPTKQIHPVVAERAQAYSKAVVEYIKENIFPIIGA